MLIELPEDLQTLVKDFDELFKDGNFHIEEQNVYIKMWESYCMIWMNVDDKVGSRFWVTGWQIYSFVSRLRFTSQSFESY